MLLQCYSLGLLTLLTGRTLLTDYDLGTGLVILVAAALPQLAVMLWASPRILKNHIFVHSITHINQSIVEEVMEIMEIVRPPPLLFLQPYRCVHDHCARRREAHAVSRVSRGADIPLAHGAGPGLHRPPRVGARRAHREAPGARGAALW